MTNEEVAYLIHHRLNSIESYLNLNSISHSKASRQFRFGFASLATIIQFHPAYILEILQDRQAQLSKFGPPPWDSTIGVTPVGAGEQRSDDTGAPGA